MQRSCRAFSKSGSRRRNREAAAGVANSSANTGGERGIRTLDTGVSPYNGLANRRLQPLGHLSSSIIKYIQNIDCVLAEVCCVANVHARRYSVWTFQSFFGRDRARCKQAREIVETRTAFFDRYYTSDTCDNGRRKPKAVKLADKGDIYRSKGDVQHLLSRRMEAVNTGKKFPSAQLSLTDFIEKHYLPWRRGAEKSAATGNGYKRVWERYWQKHAGRIPLTDLRTSDATAVLIVMLRRARVHPLSDLKLKY